MEGASPKARIDARPPAAALTWRERHTIASDVARGLVFLHTVADPRVIHQDVKPANILLGAAPVVASGSDTSTDSGVHIVAKLADFGISRVVPDLAATAAKSYIKTHTAMGTPVYMPMEYHTTGRVSAKTDTYAFGIVLLELLTGRPPFDPETREPLADAVYQALLDPKRFMRDTVDPRAGEWSAKKWHKLAVIARRCKASESAERCVVADVVQEIDALADRGGRRGRQRWGF